MILNGVLYLLTYCLAMTDAYMHAHVFELLNVYAHFITGFW